MQQDLLNEHNIAKLPTEISYIRISSILKVVQQGEWIFELGIGDGTVSLLFTNFCYSRFSAKSSIKQSNSN